MAAGTLGRVLGYLLAKPLPVVLPPQQQEILIESGPNDGIIGMMKTDSIKQFRMGEFVLNL